MRSKGRKALRRIISWGLRALATVGLALFVLGAAQVLTLRFIDPPFTLRTAWGSLQRTLGVGKPLTIAHYWRSLERISPHLRRAVLAGEDQRFLSHRGFDFIEMRAAFREILRGKRIRGASTISMQTARSVFLWPGGGWVRKLLEAFYTVWIEAFWNKARIIEIYLNTVDWGQGVMGAEAAARKYFATTAGRLTLEQAAFLAAILPSPHRWTPTATDDNLRWRQERIRRDMMNMPLVKVTLTGEL